MPQLRNNWVTAQDMVRSRAWRFGYESYRLGEPPEFVGRGTKSLAYEYGRLTAAFLRGQGRQLLRVSTTRPISDVYVPELAEALVQCTNAPEASPPDTCEGSA